MRGLDTNVLVRFLARDDAGQAARAKAVIQEVVEAGETCHIGVVVLCELVWVLGAAYGYARSQVASAVEALLDAASFSIEDRDLVRVATREYRTGRGDFADYVIGLRNRRDGCGKTVTFDRTLKGSDLFTVI